VGLKFSNRSSYSWVSPYSHSRLRQLILGGVTRHVLERADLPVIMNR